MVITNEIQFIACLRQVSIFYLVNVYHSRINIHACTNVVHNWFCSAIIVYFWNVCLKHIRPISEIRLRTKGSNSYKKIYGSLLSLRTIASFFKHFFFIYPRRVVDIIRDLFKIVQHVLLHVIEISPSMYVSSYRLNRGPPSINFYFFFWWYLSNNLFTA